MSFPRKRLAVLGAAIVIAGAVAVPLAFGATFVGFLNSADTQQVDRLFRDGTPSSTCDVHGKPNPGLWGDAGSRSYDRYHFTNTTTAAQCVRVTLQHNCGDGTGGTLVNAFTVAYSSFVPADPSANYLADAGQSGTPQSFMFRIGAGHSYDVVVSQVDFPLTHQCPYVLKVNAS
jgi:hypothetical protein